MSDESQSTQSTQSTQTIEPTTPTTEPAETPKLSRAARRADLFGRVTEEAKAAAKAIDEKLPDDQKEEPKEPPEEPEPTPQEPQTKEEKADAARFAALAREKQKARAYRDEGLAARKQADERVAAAEKRVSEAEKRAADVDAMLQDPDRFFTHVVEKLGIKTQADFQRFAAKALAAPKADGPKPLTQADLDKALENQRIAQANQTRIAEVRKKWDSLFDYGDDANPRPGALWDSERRWREGDRLAAALNAQGRSFTLEDLADAVDELASQDPAVKRLLGKLQPATSTEKKPESKPAVKPEAKKPEPATKPESASKKPLTHRERIAAMREALKS